MKATFATVTGRVRLQGFNRLRAQVFCPLDVDS